ncbi:MAG: hypothetical protein IPN32_02865 [Deltaproteobacteria bacterium]|nr:hypothetical protein [Deltaproteobacteria bacterium]
MVFVLAALAASGCADERPPGTAAKLDGKTPVPQQVPPVTDSKTPDSKTPDTKAGTGPDAKAAPDQPLATVGDGPLPLAGLLGKSPAEVEAQLAEPLGKGMARKSCVRYLPERTWFQCAFAMQRYGDKNGAFKAVGIEYEDGKATAVAFDGLLGASGPFAPATALAYVGLTLPGEPKVDAPGGNATVYSWFNRAARLLIDGKQYRVVVSTVDEDWARTKVEVILNQPLTPQQQALVLPPAGAAAPEPGAG